MVKRKIQKELRTLAREFPIVAVLGPRQSGKTTVARAVFNDFDYYSFEDPDIRTLAREDPRAFLEQHPRNVIFDEVQRIPEFISYLQSHADNADRPGRIIITGSQNYLLMENITQSLAGRVGIATLLPFSTGELLPIKKYALPLEEYIVTGGYPRIYDKNIRPVSFFRTYVNTYIEKDVRSLRNIVNYDDFVRFVGILAGRTGQVLNTLAISDDCGISHNTVKQWLSVLETGYIIHRLWPYHKNYNKRLIKNPKIYFYDTGLVCYLLGIHSVEAFNTHYYRGPIFETFILSELMKYTYNTNRSCRFYFWRDNHQKETDLIVEKGTERITAEVKSGKTVQPRFFQALEYWQKLSGDGPAGQYLIYGGTDDHERHGIKILGWQNSTRILQ